MCCRKKSTLSTPILKSYGYLFNFHLGTVALGSMLIAIVQLIRIIFKAITSTVKDPKNDVTRALYKAFSCCIYCLEKILVYLTRNAYIEVGERAEWFYSFHIARVYRYFPFNDLIGFQLFSEIICGRLVNELIVFWWITRCECWPSTRSAISSYFWVKHW